MAIPSIHNFGSSHAVVSENALIPAKAPPVMAKTSMNTDDRHCQRSAILYPSPVPANETPERMDKRMVAVMMFVPLLKIFWQNYHILLFNQQISMHLVLYVGFSLFLRMTDLPQIWVVHRIYGEFWGTNLE